MHLPLTGILIEATVGRAGDAGASPCRVGATRRHEIRVEGALLHCLGLANQPHLLLLGFDLRLSPLDKICMLHAHVAASIFPDALCCPLSQDPALGAQLGTASRGLIELLARSGGCVVHSVEVELLELGAELTRVEAHEELADTPSLGVCSSCGRCCRSSSGSGLARVLGHGRKVLLWAQCNGIGARTATMFAEGVVAAVRAPATRLLEDCRQRAGSRSGVGRRICRTAGCLGAITGVGAVPR
mmetsp:Transcript_8464/g.18445  ORF Transcript_8464/g.18445 Transcript_8464/m.18445 type:complete len:243 (-) Transcript_8464:1701-2429(-)